jgi:hypothetical protein
MVSAHSFMSAGESAHRNREAVGVSTSKQFERLTFGIWGKMQADA